MFQASILVDDTGNARLTDFTLSAVAPDSGSTVSMTEGHAARWTAPEVLDMEQPVTKASDVFSFGMVMYEVRSVTSPEQNTRLIGTRYSPEWRHSTIERQLRRLWTFC